MLHDFCKLLCNKKYSNIDATILKPESSYLYNPIAHIIIMKKFILIAVLIVSTTFTSCRVTKTFTMLNAKSQSEQNENDFIQNKADKITFLNLSEDQKQDVVKIWKAEKISLGNAREKKNSEIATILLKSENDFRAVLTEGQLKNYRESYKNLYTSGYLNDKQLEELKRIYKL